MARDYSVRQAAFGTTAGTVGRGSQLAVKGLVVVVLVVVAFGLGLLPSLLRSQRQPVFTSTAYHFSVRYPLSWSASTIAQTSDASPLTLVITKQNAPSALAPAVGQPPGLFASTFTVIVFSLSNPGVTASVRALPSNPSMQRTTLAGQPAYKAVDETGEQGPGAQVVVAHTDYYLVHGDYEYQISTDALSNDPSAEAELQGMLKSFTFLS